ncbi:MAG: hypothetical protein LBF49_01765 [Puniceicoccales bacterium]|nr:hypothetical protein [Puniceicoccales bacterium]
MEDKTFFPKVAKEISKGRGKGDGLRQRYAEGVQSFQSISQPPPVEHGGVFAKLLRKLAR